MAIQCVKRPVGCHNYSSSVKSNRRSEVTDNPTANHHNALDGYPESGYPTRATSILRGTVPDSLLALQLSDEIVYVELKDLRYFEELDEVEPALAGLVLGDEGLMTLQPLGKLNLREPGVFAGLHQELTETSIERAERRFGHP
jgi:hypothetical protein